MALPQRFRILSLPLELRNMIYRLVLGNVKIFLSRIHGRLPSEPAYSGILLASQDIRKEVLPLLWAHGEFTVNDVGSLPSLRNLIGKPMEGIRILHLQFTRFDKAGNLELLSVVPNLKFMIVDLHQLNRVTVPKLEGLVGDDWNTESFNGFKNIIIDSPFFAPRLIPMVVEFMESVVTGRPGVEVLFAQTVIVESWKEKGKVELEMEFGFTRLEDGNLSFRDHKVRERTVVQYYSTRRLLSVG